MKLLQWPRNSLAVLLIVLMAGCGYHFAASGDSLPKSAQTIYVAPFSNPTLNTGVQDEFARYMKDEIARHARLTVVDSAGGADLQLTGVIERVEPLPAALNAVGEPTVYNLNLVANATLYDNRTHQVLWSGQNVTSAVQYGVTQQGVLLTSPQFLKHNLRSQDIAQLTDSQVQQTQYSTARDQSMGDLARNIYSGMSEGL